MAFSPLKKMTRTSQAAALAAALLLTAGCTNGIQVVVPSDAGLPTAVTADLVPLATRAPGIRQEMRYATRHNFLGRPVAGYEAGECWLSRAPVLCV